MKQFVVAVAVACVLIIVRQANAQPAPTINVDEYEITPAAGPFAICAAGFTGEDAGARAHDLAVAVRQTYKLPAYTFFVNRKERQERQAKINEIRQLTPEVDRRKIRGTRVENEYAVLIGGYQDFDAASKGVKELKKRVQADIASDNITVGWLRFVTTVSVGGKVGPDGKEVPGEKRLDHPLMHAFATRNPTVPMDKAAVDNKPDPFLKKLNEDEQYSLLKCRKPWTLAIKEFQGPATLAGSQSDSSTFLEKLGVGKSSRDVLTASALQAHEVAKVLRDYPQLKLEAYVLHTRHSSVVCVGGYDSIDDPKLQQMQRELTKLKFNGAKFDFFKQPLPMQVPQF